MIKWIAVAAFVLALAASAKAMTAQPKVQAEGLTTPVAYACGATLDAHRNNSTEAPYRLGELQSMLGS
jgi:hypothetical protein